MPTIRSLLPSLAFFHTNTLCEDKHGNDVDAYGPTVQILWFGFVIELTVAREDAAR